MDRFYVDDLPREVGARVRLPDEEAHHLAVRRIAAGAEVRLFDGRGGEVRARLVAARKRHADLEVLEEVLTPAPAVAVTVGLAVPKGKRARAFLEKATELGAAAVFPLVTRRATGGAREAAAAVASEKWRRTTIEAAKQSGAARLPELLPPRTLDDVIAAPPAEGELRLILHPGPAARPLRELLAGRRPERALVLVGPEGGFEDEEVAAAGRAGIAAARLGSTVLRIETAAVAALGAMVAAWE